MKLLINSLAFLATGFCLYQALSPTAQSKAFKGCRQAAFIILLASLVLTLWSLSFYALMGLPLASVKPWSALWFVRYCSELDWLTNLRLFALPLLACGLGALTLLSPVFESPQRHLYGNAHFATRREIKKMGFLNERGNVLVGRAGAKLLRYTLTNHLLVFAPSRSGKGVSLVIPNALHWQGSLLALDNKGEIFDASSGYRAFSGNRVFRFSPASPDFKTHCINPLDYVSRDNPSRRIADLHLILDILIAGSSDENKMWAEEARSLALGLLLWLLQSKRRFALSELASMVKSGNLEDFLLEVIAAHTIADNLITLDHAAYLAIQNFLQKAPKEQSGVRSTLASMLRLWEDPLICAATNRSDVDFRDFRKTPTTLYFSFGTNQIVRLAPLINLLIQLFLNVMLAHLPKADEPVKVLCLLDEINRFGRMDKLKDGFGDLAGYGVHLMPIIQNIGQFYTLYGGRDGSDIFFQNADLKIGFRQNTPTDKEFLSRECGSRTVRLKNRSYASTREGSQYSESLIERPLLSPAEVGSLPKHQAILLTGDGLIRCKKISYFRDQGFKEKCLAPLPIPAIAPQFPVIDVKKEVPAPEEEKQVPAKAVSPGTEIGQALAAALSPLIERLIPLKAPQTADKKTASLIHDLACEFEKKGDDA